jgi:ACS family hexuronate transporter-like MFS transporter
MPKSPSQLAARVGRYRWFVCALLFLASTINYIDRQVIGILKPTLESPTELGWSESDYGWIVFAFSAAYAIGLLLSGRLVDRLGTRMGFSLAVVVWSLAAMGCSLARTVGQFCAARFVLGLGESANFPTSIKAVAEWFPQRERAFATGLFNAGTNVGALLTPIIVPAITVVWGWRWAFVITGALGFVWLALWLVFFRKPEEEPRLSPEELAYIKSDPPERTEPVPWGRLALHRPTWAFALGKFLTDPVWWIYLFWLPDFLHKRYGLSLTEYGPPLVVIYLMADVGSIAGGWLSSRLIERGWTANAARKTTMLVCALSVVPIAFASQVSSLWVAVLLVGLATAAHQGWSANLYTLVSDTFPRPAVASVVGMGGMAGAIGGMVIARVVAELLERTGSYVPVFVIASGAYLFALLVVHLISPRLEPARL